MATFVSNRARRVENLELYCLIWLDASVNSSQENLHAQQQLRSSINHLLTFEDDHQCLQYIHLVPKDDRIVLIVSGRLGQIIVPKVVQLRQMSSIYVYCMDKKANEEWAQHFSKVKGVMVGLDQLIQQIKTDQTQRQHHKTDEPLAFRAFNPNVQGDERSSTEFNGQFLHSQLLIDCLIRMKPSSDERRELILVCEEEYQNNPTELQIVKEFERNYSSDRSFWWYTRQSFLYRVLNKALRVQNIDVLYLFRFFIRDLEKELRKKPCVLPVHVYRAQEIFQEEIKMLKNCVGQYISMNSFLSTSVDRQKARLFLSTNVNRREARPVLFPSNHSADVEQVFFQIDADPRLKNIKPFSNITSLSYFPREEEVLFMAGSIFRLAEMKRDNEGIWNIRMSLCSENDHQLQSLFQHMKNELSIEQTTLFQFGHILRKMGKLDDAENYYHRYLHQLSNNHPNLSACYNALGRVAHDQGYYDTSLNWYNKSLDLAMRTLDSNHSNIALTHNGIANVYRKKGDYVRALKSYEKALVIFQKIHGEDHSRVAMCLNNMGLVQEEQHSYLKALEYHWKALIIWKKHLPADHPNLGTSHNNIGVIHARLGHHDQALEHYNVSLKIKSKSLPLQHPSIAEIHENIGLVYENKGDFQQALFHIDKAATIYRYSLSSTNSRVIEIDRCIRRISSKLK